MKPIRVHQDNLDKHGVSLGEVKECFHPRKHKYLRKVGPRVYKLVAQSGAGRYLEFLYKDLPEERIVFHAMDARPRDVKLLKRKGKRG